MNLGRRKVIRDLSHSKSRSVLVILVIAIGVAAFGMLNTARVILGKDYLASYRATNPAHVVLTGLVGGVGLSGTLSINVMERTREIGILRSMGATRGHLWQLVIVEGLVIGLVSLIPAVLLALPLTFVMNGGMGLALFGFALPFTFVGLGLVLWAGLVLLLSLVATVGPARRAGQVTIREAIAYG